MSDPEHSANAKDIKDMATDWFERRDRPDWTQSDQAELDAWLTASPAHLIAYWRVESAWTRIDRLSALRPIKPDGGRDTSSRQGLIFFKSAVAAMGVCLLVAGGFFVTQGSSRQTYATSVGGREIIRLADGSQIELNTDTVVQISTRRKERKVWLEKGEAFFQVTHDAAHPFMVMAGNHRIIDLGTKFLVRSDSDRLKVSVVQGKVSVASADDRAKPQSLLLGAGDVVMATADAMSVKRASDSQLSNALGWRRGVLIFYHTPLSEAVREINRYNREKIVVADAGAAGQTVNGTFPATSVQAFVDVAQSIFQLHVAKRDGEVVISR